MLAEGRLHRMELVAVGEALDRRNLRALGLYREQGAALDGVAVYEDDAGAALAGLAADVRPGETQVLAQELNQQRSGLDIALNRLAVHRHAYGGRHDFSLPLGLIGARIECISRKTAPERGRG